MIVAPEETRIWNLFKYCVEAFGRVGMMLSFPPNTDPKKTYKWRYLDNFCKRIDEWGISDETGYKVVDAIVEHAIRHNKLKTHGLSILISNNALEIGIKGVQQYDDKVESLIQSITKQVRMLDGYQDRLSTLLRHEKLHESPNIVKWFIQGKLTAQFIALSRSCGLAMRQLTPTDRAMLPNKFRIIELQHDCLVDIRTKMRLKLLLGKDWGILC